MTSSVKPALSKVAFVSASFGVKALDLLSVLVCLILDSILTFFALFIGAVSTLVVLFCCASAAAFNVNVFALGFVALPSVAISVSGIASPFFNFAYKASDSASPFNGSCRFKKFFFGITYGSPSVSYTTISPSCTTLGPSFVWISVPGFTIL